MYPAEIYKIQDYSSDIEGFTIYMGICEVREALAKFNPNPVKVKFIANNTE
jgi:hypothetical protein